MGAVTPLTVEHRELLSRLARDHPNLSANQVANLFRARTGRRLGKDAVIHARRGKYDQVNDRIRLDDRHRETLELLVRENADECSWSEIARVFAGATGRPVTRWSVAKLARKMGIAAKKGGGRREATGRTVERGLAVAHAAKLADAPYRPGYFARGYRGEGEPMVYRAVDTSKEGGCH